MSASSVASPAELSEQEESHKSAVAHAHDTLAAGLLFMMLANVGQRAIGFFRNLSFCRFLDEGSLGQWALASSFFLLAAPLTVLGLPGTFGKLVESFRIRGQLLVFLRRVAYVSSCSVVLAVVLLLWNHEQAGSWILGAPATLGTMSLITFALCSVIIFNTTTELLNSLRLGRVVSKMHTVNSLAFTAISVAGLFYYRDWRVVVVAFGISSLIGVLPGIKSLRTALATQSSPTEPIVQRVFWKRVFPFAVSIWTMNLLANMFDVVDRYMILYLAPSHEIGTAMVGQFHSARILPLLLTSLTLMLSSLLLPYLAADWESGQRRKVSDSIRLTAKMSIYFFFMLSVGALAVAPVLFTHLLEGKYDQGLSILPLALMHCCFIATATLLQNYFWCIERGRVVGFILAAGLGVNILLNSWWVPIYGLHGAMSATAIAGAIILVSTILALAKYRVRLDYAALSFCILPITLLAGPVVAMVLGVAVFILASRSPYLLSSGEKEQLDNAVVPQLARLRLQLRSLWHSS